MEIKYLQSDPKFCQVEWCIMLSIAQPSSSSSKCKDDSLMIWFFVPISWICPVLYFQTHAHPLYCDVEKYEPFTIQLFCKHTTCGTIQIGDCSSLVVVACALNQSWYSAFACLISSKISMYILLNILSFLVFFKDSKFFMDNDLSTSKSAIPFFCRKW